MRAHQIRDVFGREGDSNPVVEITDRLQNGILCLIPPTTPPVQCIRVPVCSPFDGKTSSSLVYQICQKCPMLSCGRRPSLIVAWAFCTAVQIPHDARSRGPFFFTAMTISTGLDAGRSDRTLKTGTVAGTILRLIIFLTAHHRGLDLDDRLTEVKTPHIHSVRLIG